MSEYEIVHTITDWYDGAREGIAELNGVPHHYKNQWLEGEQNWSDIYFLKPLDAETFALAMEDWEIWLRWEKAFKEGKTTQDTHPALREDRQRHEELLQVLTGRLTVTSEISIRAKAHFLYGQPTKVKWIIQSKL